MLTQTISIKPESANEVHVQVYREALDSRTHVVDISQKYEPDFDMTAWWFDTDESIVDLCRFLSLSGVRPLFVRAGRVPDHAWLALFKATPNVRELVAIDCTDFYALPDALLYRTSEKNERSASSAYRYALPGGPCLQRLTLVGCYFFAHETAREQPHVLVEELLNCFIERHENGAEIEAICFRDCVNVDEGDIELLEEVVRVVDWDGVSVCSDCE